MKPPFWLITTCMVAVGGAVGALGRYWLSESIHYFFDRQFPIAILSVNVLGSLLMGFLSVLIVDNMQHDVVLRGFVLIGFLGAFTTFSTFSLDTIKLFEQGHYNTALLNIGMSVILCLLAAAVGLWLGKTFFIA